MEVKLYRLIGEVRAFFTHPDAKKLQEAGIRQFKLDLDQAWCKLGDSQGENVTMDQIRILLRCELNYYANWRNGQVNRYGNWHTLSLGQYQQAQSPDTPAGLTAAVGVLKEAQDIEHFWMRNALPVKSQAKLVAECARRVRACDRALELIEGQEPYYLIAT